LNLQNEFGKESDIFAHSAIIESDDVIVTLKKQLYDLESKIVANKVDYKDSHPQVISLRKQYEQKKTISHERSIESLVAKSSHLIHSWRIFVNRLSLSSLKKRRSMEE
jgi:putative protein kinase ArgK-like GTPase of G3E family